MEAVILIHGITGSKLAQQQGSKLVEIWPPDRSDLGGYSPAKFSVLLDKPLKVTGIIDTAMDCYPVYAPIEADLKDICTNHTKAEYDVFCYDWRQNIFNSMSELAAKLKAVGTKKSVTSITLVCHSLGGLIARLVLESNIYSAGPKNPWFAKINRVLFVCTPHMGAPVALSEFLGLETVDIVVSRKDVQLGAKTWESAYQLLPAPNYPGNPVILDDGAPEDFYQHDVALELGLDPAKLESITKKTFSTLDFNNKPPAVQYSFIVGTSHQTDRGIDIDSYQTPPSFAPITNNLGDGTVPIFSASYTGGTGVPTEMPGDHVGVMNTYAFQVALYGYFGVSAAPPPLHLKKPTAVISLNKRVYSPGEKMSVLIIPDVETKRITTRLKVSRVTGLKGQLAPHGPEERISYQGGATKFIRMSLNAPNEVGGFRLDLEGEDSTHVTTDRTAGRFAVVKR